MASEDGCPGRRPVRCISGSVSGRLVARRVDDDGARDPVWDQSEDGAQMGEPVRRGRGGGAGGGRHEGRRIRWTYTSLPVQPLLRRCFARAVTTAMAAAILLIASGPASRGQEPVQQPDPPPQF